MPQYAVLIYAGDSAHTDSSAQADDQQPAGHAEHDRHADELGESGSMLAAYALTPRDLATSIRAGGVTDGPFIDTKEIVAGFYILEAPDLDVALAIAGSNPAIAAGGGLEVRPVHSGGPVERRP